MAAPWPGRRHPKPGRESGHDHTRFRPRLGVTNTSTYGTLPQRLQQQAAAQGITLNVTDLWLSEYVSFDDAVTMADVVRAFDRALRDLHLLDASFACITHSTGGPVVR